MQIVDAGFQPICEKLFMYEMLVGCKMTAENAGVPEHIKQLEPDLEPVFLAGQRIDEGTGERLEKWAQSRADTPKPPADPIEDVVTITTDQAIALETRCIDNGITVAQLKAAAKVERLSLILASDLDRANGWIDKKIAAKETA